MAIKSTFRQTTPPFLQLGIPYSVAPLNSSRPPEYRDLDGPSKAPSVKCVRFAPMSSNIQPVAKPKRQPQSSVPSSDSMSAVVRKVELDDSKPLFVVRRLLSREKRFYHGIINYIAIKKLKTMFVCRGETTGAGRV